MEDALLAFLRRSLQAPSLAWAEPPERIAGGFDTTIYGFQLTGAPAPFTGRLILRLFRDPPGALQARFEAAVHTAVASRGYAAPRVLAVGTVASELGRAFLILERIPGRNLLDALFSPLVLRIPELLGEAQARLHALDATGFENELAAASLPTQRLHLDYDLHLCEVEIERLALDGLFAGFRWLVAGRPRSRDRPVICHGDFHPLNVLVDRGTVSGVIDWTRVHIADAAYDIGGTVALLSHGPVELSPLLRPLARAGRRALVTLYLRAYAKHRALDRTAIRWFEALRCLQVLIEAGEHQLANAGRVQHPSKPSAFAAPETVEGIAARLRALTGAEVAMPSSCAPGGRLPES